MRRHLTSIRCLLVGVVAAAVLLGLNYRRERWLRLGSEYRAQAARIRAGLLPLSGGPPLPSQDKSPNHAPPILHDVRAYESAARWAFDEAVRYRFGIFTLLLAASILVIVELYGDSVRRQRKRKRTLMRLATATKQAISGAKPGRDAERSGTSTEGAEP